MSRELRRLGPSRVTYWATPAHAQARARWRRRPGRLAQHPPLPAAVLTGLRRRGSPEEMARRLQAESPDDRTMRGSHETISRSLYVLPRGALQRELLRCLRSRRRYRQRRGAIDTRRRLVEPLLIDPRPPEGADRTIPGH